jgi:hypothetical protein
MLHVEANSCDRPQFVGLRIYCRMDWQGKSNEIEKIGAGENLRYRYIAAVDDP